MSSSLGRAFTTKRAPKPADISTPLPKRSVTTKHSMGTIRHKISGPLELISTTNMLSYNAPDIYPTKAMTPARSSANSATHSGDESDRSLAGTSTPLTSPDTSSMESSPTSLEPNHLSCYFGGPSRQSSSSAEAPIIPQRALSHTKRTAEVLAHQRSTSRTSSSTKSNSMSSRISASKNSMSQARSSINMFAANVETMEHHPFGKELAQVTEIAEEYGLMTERIEVVDPEEQELLSQGFFKFNAAEYINEIQPLFESCFSKLKSKPAMASMWI